jgi:7-cyano-7-deazaguanine synthase
MPKAVCLLSGGLDSATCLAIARSEEFTCYALSFDYGQRHKVELEAAAKIAASLGAKEHKVARIDLRIFGHSALTDDIAVPKHNSVDSLAHGIPITYVPARNTIFLSFALAYAEVLEASDIFIGVNAIDYSGYPDCRAEYIEAFQRMGNLATKAGVEGRTKLKIHMPLAKLTKADIVKQAVALGLDLGATHSCYDPDADGRACGRCDSCLLRKKGFEEAGVRDPLAYQVA